MSNSLDPDQEHFVWPDLGPNCLQKRQLKPPLMGKLLKYPLPVIIFIDSAIFVGLHTCNFLSFLCTAFLQMTVIISLHVCDKINDVICDDIYLIHILLVSFSHFDQYLCRGLKL